jgi:hypothetical protein
MDARSFQQHAARVAELTDALLAERAANKPPHTLTAKSAAHPPASGALSAASVTPSSHASPQATPSSSPDRQSGTGQAEAHHSASVAPQTGTFESANGSDVAQDQQHGGEPSEGQLSRDREHAGDFTAASSSWTHLLHCIHIRMNLISRRSSSRG